MLQIQKRPLAWLPLKVELQRQALVPWLAVVASVATSSKDAQAVLNEQRKKETISREILGLLLTVVFSYQVAVMSPTFADISRFSCAYGSSQLYSISYLADTP